MLPRASRQSDELPPDADLRKPSADLLLFAYRHGMFPMVDPDTDEIGWFAPDPRGVIPIPPPEAFHIPRNLARELRKRRFTIRSDTAFERVMRECATDRDEFNRSWMNEQLLQSYVELFRRGHAHSIEAWLGTPPHEELVGGLYGVHIGGAFFGESMFSRPSKGGSNSSKVCLVHLVRWLHQRGFVLLDTQFVTDHLRQFGCMEVELPYYRAMLVLSIAKEATWGEFSAA